MEHMPHETSTGQQLLGDRRTAVLIALVAFLLVAAGAGWRWASSRKEHGTLFANSQPAKRIVRWEGRIDGLDCLLCAAGLQSRLRQLPGVAKADVSFQDKLAAVDYDPHRTDVTRLRRAIQDSGFKVTAEDPPSSPSRSKAQSESQY